MKIFRNILMAAAAVALMASPAAAQVNSPFPFVASALTATVVPVKLMRGALQWGICYNANASVEYVQVFDSAGTVTLGTTAPNLTIALAPSAVTPMPFPAVMLNGLQIAATTTPTGNTAPGTPLSCNFGFN
jgi:hypothetical protein